MFPIFAAKLAVPSYQKHQVCDCESKGENLHRRKAVVEKNFGAYETCAPERNGDDGE